MTEIPGGGPEDLFATGGGPEELEQYLESLRGAPVAERYDSGRAVESTLTRHPNPEALLSAVRLERLEDEDIATGAEMPNDYVVGRVADILKDRKIAAGRSWEELKEDELLQELDEATLEKVREMRAKGFLPKRMEHEQYFGRALHVGGYGLGETSLTKEIEESYEKRSGKKINVRYRTISETLTYFGSPEQRQAFSARCDILRGEILVRHLLMKNWSRYKFNRENLSGLVEFYFGPVPTVGGLERLYNLPGRKGAEAKTAAGVDLRSEIRERGADESEEDYAKYLENNNEGVFGNKIEMAMRLYYINALSEKKSRFLRLMSRPGWEQFVFPKGTPQELVEKWIGRPEDWVFEERLESEEETRRRGRKGDRRTKGTLKKEIGEGKRGLLTQGNIFAKTEVARNKNLDEGIREFLGGGKDADKKSQGEALAAQRIAYRVFKMQLMADDEGYEVYYDPEGQFTDDPLAGKILSFENGPAASDFGKLTHPWLYMIKSFRQIRDYSSPSGLANAKAGYERFCVSFLRQTNVPYKVEVKLPDESTQTRVEKRSFEELWWGHPEEELEVDVNGKRAKVLYPEEEAARLGDMPWSRLKEVEEGRISEEDAEELGLEVAGIHDESLVSLYLSPYMAGRKEIGTYPIVVNTSIGERELTDYGFWRKFWKALDVGVKDGVAVYGEFRGLSGAEIDKQKKTRKIRTVETFVKGFQSLPQWQEWEKQKREYYVLSKGRSEEMTVAQRIIGVAKESLEQLDVELKMFQSQDLYKAAKT